jgi:hypothetical protein
MPSPVGDSIPRRETRPCAEPSQAMVLRQRLERAISSGDADLQGKAVAEILSTLSVNVTLRAECTSYLIGPLAKCVSGDIESHWRAVVQLLNESLAASCPVAYNANSANASGSSQGINHHAYVDSRCLGPVFWMLYRAQQYPLVITSWNWASQTCAAMDSEARSALIACYAKVGRLGDVTRELEELLNDQLTLSADAQEAVIQLHCAVEEPQLETMLQLVEGWKPESLLHHLKVSLPVLALAVKSERAAEIAVLKLAAKVAEALTQETATILSQRSGELLAQPTGRTGHPHAILFADIRGHCNNILGPLLGSLVQLAVSMQAKCLGVEPPRDWLSAPQATKPIGKTSASAAGAKSAGSEVNIDTLESEDTATMQVATSESEATAEELEDVVTSLLDRLTQHVQLLLRIEDPAPPQIQLQQQQQQQPFEEDFSATQLPTPSVRDLVLLQSSVPLLGSLGSCAILYRQSYLLEVVLLACRLQGSSTAPNPSGLPQDGVAGKDVNLASAKERRFNRILLSALRPLPASCWRLGRVACEQLAVELGGIQLGPEVEAWLEVLNQTFQSDKILQSHRAAANASASPKVAAQTAPSEGLDPVDQA